MAAETLPDPTEPFTVATVAISAMLKQGVADGTGLPRDAEVYVNLYPATHEQFNAVLENADKAHIDYALDVINGRVRLQLGNRPGAPVTVWHPNVEKPQAA